MVIQTYSIEVEKEVQEEHYPEFLVKDLDNFKKKHARLKLSDDDKDAVKFFKKAYDLKIEPVKELKGIHRVKKRSKHYFVYTLNLKLLDEDGNDVGQYCHTYGTERLPVIREVTSPNGQIKRIPNGIRIEHKIPFTDKEIDNIIKKMCDEDYREEIRFTYSELPADSNDPYNMHKKYSIKSIEVFKQANYKQLQKLIAKKKN